MSTCLYKEQEYNLSNEDDRKLLAGKGSFANQIAALAADWYGESNSLTFKTSGTTGTYKEVVIPKSKIQLSAELTVKHFNLDKKDTALAILDPTRIGGSMVIIRALLAEMKIIALEPNSDFASNSHLVKECSFTSMVPIQLRKIFSDQLLIEHFKSYKAILVGGAPINYSLQRKITENALPVYETFGMTETVSHFALRDLRKSSNPFTVIGANTISQNSNGCLVIKGELTDQESFATNDIVHLIDEKHFEWVGRSDFIINSGGVKVNPEKVERIVARTIYDLGITNRFIVSSVPDDSLGQRIVLVLEGESLADDVAERLLQSFKANLDKYENPKEIRYLEKFPETANFKVNRKEVISILA